MNFTKVLYLDPGVNVLNLYFSYLCLLNNVSALQSS